MSVNGGLAQCCLVGLSLTTDIVDRRSTRQLASWLLLDQARPVNFLGQRRAVEGRIVVVLCIHTEEGVDGEKAGNLSRT